MGSVAKILPLVDFQPFSKGFWILEDKKNYSQKNAFVCSQPSDGVFENGTIFMAAESVPIAKESGATNTTL